MKKILAVLVVAVVAAGCGANPTRHTPKMELYAGINVLSAPLSASTVLPVNCSWLEGGKLQVWGDLLRPVPAGANILLILHRQRAAVAPNADVSSLRGVVDCLLLLFGGLVSAVFFADGVRFELTVPVKGRRISSPLH